MAAGVNDLVTWYVNKDAVRSVQSLSACTRVHFTFTSQELCDVRGL